MADSTKGHPAWQEILKDLPESLHPIIEPALKKWDEGVTARIEEIKNQYAPYQEFIDNNITDEEIRNGLGILYHAQNNPQDVINNLNEQMNLGYLSPAEVEALKAQTTPASNEPGDEWDEDEMPDLTKHPEFVAMKTTLEEFQRNQQKQAEEAAAAAQKTEMEKELETLKNGLKEGQLWDDTYVLSLMAAGVDGETAVTRYNEAVNQAAAQLAQQNGFTPNAGEDNQPPVILGAEGTAGSGTQNQDINFGSMGQPQIKQTVMEFLKAQENGS